MPAVPGKRERRGDAAEREQMLGHQQPAVGEQAVREHGGDAVVGVRLDGAHRQGERLRRLAARGQFQGDVGVGLAGTEPCLAFGLDGGAPGGLGLAFGLHGGGAGGFRLLAGRIRLLARGGFLGARLFRIRAAALGQTALPPGRAGGGGGQKPEDADGREPAPQGTRPGAGAGELVGLVALRERAQREGQRAGDHLEPRQFELLFVGADLFGQLAGGQRRARRVVFFLQGRAIGRRGGPAFLASAVRARVRRNRLGAGVPIQRAVLARDAEAQRLGETLGLRRDARALFARVVGRVRLAVDHQREDAVGLARFLEKPDFLGDEARLHRARRTDHHQQLAVGQGRADVGRQVGVGGQFLLVAEHRVEAGRDRLAARVRRADEIRGHLVGLQRLVQPRGPLAPRLFVVGVAIADEDGVLPFAAGSRR